MQKSYLLLDKNTVRSSFVTLLLLTKLCDAFRVLSTATVLRDVLIVALGVHVVVVLTHTPLVNVIDAKTSFDEAVVEVKVDRCIDENSASNHG